MSGNVEWIDYFVCSCLLNTSGSGKTRVLIDGLREHWGFYLNCGSASSMVGIESTDLETFMDLECQSSFTPTLPSTTSNSPELHQNINVVRHLTWQVMVAHLLVLRMFLEEARALRPSSSLDIYRHHWVHLQVQSRSVTGVEIFGQVARDLANASEAYLLGVANTTMQWILECLPIDSLYVVLDEAQRAAKLYREAFRSRTKPMEPRPILHCLVRSIDGLGVHLRTIISGTGLSMKLVSAALDSRMAKPLPEPEIINLIGAFDSKPVQHAYVLKYLPPGYGDTPSGKRLLNRVWDWLRGRYVISISMPALLIILISRHRFTATFVEMLIRNHFHSPHKLLNEYVHCLTGMNASDSPCFVGEEPNIDRALLKSMSFMSFEKLTDGKLSAAVLQLQATSLMTPLDAGHAGRFGEIICSWMLHQRVIPLRDEEKDWVEWGVARFVKNGSWGEQQVVVDEPLIIFAAAKHLAGTSHGLVDRVLDSMSQRGGVGEHFEDWLVVYFSLAFGPAVMLSHVFNFGNNVPDWAQIAGVELVAMSEGEGYKTSYVPDDNAGIPITLCCDSRSGAETVKWFENPDAVMCLPDIYLGPDIIFFVRIPGRGIICVTVQSRYRTMRRLDKRTQEHAESTLEPSDFYNKKVSFFAVK